MFRSIASLRGLSGPGKMSAENWRGKRRWTLQHHAGQEGVQAIAPALGTDRVHPTNPPSHGGRITKANKPSRPSPPISSPSHAAQSHRVARTVRTPPATRVWRSPLGPRHPSLRFDKMPGGPLRTDSTVSSNGCRKMGSSADARRQGFASSVPAFDRPKVLSCPSGWSRAGRSRGNVSDSRTWRVRQRASRPQPAQALVVSCAR